MPPIDSTTHFLASREGPVKLSEKFAAVAEAMPIDTVRRALVSFEPRIDVLEVTATSAAGEANLLLVRVDYRLRGNNAIGKRKPVPRKSCRACITWPPGLRR